MRIFAGHDFRPFPLWNSFMKYFQFSSGGKWIIIELLSWIAIPCHDLYRYTSRFKINLLITLFISQPSLLLCGTNVPQGPRPTTGAGGTWANHTDNVLLPPTHNRDISGNEVSVPGCPLLRSSWCIRPVRPLGSAYSKYSSFTQIRRDKLPRCCPEWYEGEKPASIMKRPPVRGCCSFGRTADTGVKSSPPSTCSSALPQLSSAAPPARSAILFQ